MDTVELEKLYWTQDLPPLQRQQMQEVRSASWPTGVEWGGSGAVALYLELRLFFLRWA